MGVRLLAQRMGDELNTFTIDGRRKGDCSGLNSTTERGADDCRYALVIWEVVSELTALGLTLVSQVGIVNPVAVLQVMLEQ